MLDKEQGELFSHAFAGALVFLEKLAKAAYDALRGVRAKTRKLEVLRRFANHMHISPVCVAKQMELYAAARGL